jgi:hypothetical protein
LTESGRGSGRDSASTLDSSARRNPVGCRRAVFDSRATRGAVQVSAGSPTRSSSSEETAAESRSFSARSRATSNSSARTWARSRVTSSSTRRSGALPTWPYRAFAISSPCDVSPGFDRPEIPPGVAARLSATGRHLHPPPPRPHRQARHEPRGLNYPAIRAHGTGFDGQPVTKATRSPQGFMKSAVTASTLPGVVGPRSCSSNRSQRARDPSATTSTRPSARFRAQPVSPSSSARVRAHHRKPTPCTRPRTNATMRTGASPSLITDCQPSLGGHTPPADSCDIRTRTRNPGIVLT